MEHKVSFYSGGYKIAALLFVPDDLKQGEKRGSIVICHGYCGWKERHSPQTAIRLNEGGYVALAFDYRGFGESEGPRWRLMPMEQVEDIRNAVTYLQTRPEVDPGKIGIWGGSFGGANVVYAAALDERVKCTLSRQGFGDGATWLNKLRRHYEWLDWLKELEEDRKERVLTGKSRAVHPLEIMIPPPESEEAWAESYKRYPERANIRIPLECAEAILEFKPEEVVHKISPRPILFISNSGDPLTPVSEQKSMYDKAKEPKKYFIIKTDKHYGGPEIREQRTKVGLEWFKQWMPP
jgi:dienelactone hydrolase